MVEAQERFILTNISDTPCYIKNVAWELTLFRMDLLSLLSAVCYVVSFMW